MPNSKFMSLSEAIKKFVHDGDQVSLGGFTVNRNPMALVYEMIRQGKRDLHLYAHSQGQALDILIGAGCVRAVELAYGANGRYATTCVMFRRAVEEGKLKFEDYTNYQMSLRFMAGAMGLPYLPTRSGLGTDIISKWGMDETYRKANPRISEKKVVLEKDPFRGETLVLVPAVNPDVTLIHAQMVDKEGTARIRGLDFVDAYQAQASQRLVISCEEICETLREEPDLNQIPYYLPDAIVSCPWGSHPTACWGYYDYDSDHLIKYRDLARDDAGFQKYLTEYITGVEGHKEYLKKVGEEKLQGIRADECGYRKGLRRS